MMIWVIITMIFSGIFENNIQYNFSRFLSLFFLHRDGQLYVVILRNQQRNTNTGPVGAEIVLYQLQRFLLLYSMRCPIPIIYFYVGPIFTWYHISFVLPISILIHFF